jgi:hypothetical protein
MKKGIYHMNQNKSIKNSVENPAEESTRKKHKWIYDVLLLAVLAAIGIGIYVYFRSTTKTVEEAGDDISYYVQVSVNNRVEALISIDEDGEYTFPNIYSSGENIIHIENGGVYMESANCPDQVCVYQGVIEPGTIIPIVCMPNYVYVSIVSTDEIEWDSVRESVVPEELMPLYEAAMQ